MHVTPDGELRDTSRERSRTVRIAGELVTVPRQPPGQRRRLVWPTVEAIYRSLAKKTGMSFATDFAVLAMAFRDTGHIFGDRSIARARRREAERGTITSQRIKPNRKAGTRRTYCGTVRVRFPDLAEKRAARWREKVERRKARREAMKRRERATKLVQQRPNETPKLEVQRNGGEPLLQDRRKIAVNLRTALAAIESAQRSALRRPEPNDAERAPVEDRRAEVERQLAELAARPDLCSAPEKPPDT